MKNKKCVQSTKQSQRHTEWAADHLADQWHSGTLAQPGLACTCVQGSQDCE